MTRATRPLRGRRSRHSTDRWTDGWRSARLTVVDATSVKRASRLDLLRRARAAGVPAIAIVLDLPAPTVHERNLARAGRVVPPEAVDAQLADLATALRPGGLDAEGFAAIYRLTDPESVDAVVIRRVTRA